MKTRLIFIVVLLMTVINLRGQDLPRPDSNWDRFMKPPPIHEMLKPPAFGIDDLQKNPVGVFTPLPATWSQFKCTFLDLPLPEEFALVERFHRNMEIGQNYPTSIWFDPEDRLRTIHRVLFLGSEGNPSVGTPIGGLSTSVIQAMYDQYSHEGKMRRKYDSLIQQDNIEYQLYPKYNVALVKQITGFTSDSTAYAFMKFCDFKNDSLLQANNYDVYMMIQNCLSQFLRQTP